MAMAARMPMIATTIMSSIRVKPLLNCLRIYFSLENSAGLRLSFILAKDVPTTPNSPVFRKLFAGKRVVACPGRDQSW
jgi:hypothetical protein